MLSKEKIVNLTKTFDDIIKEASDLLFLLRKKNRKAIELLLPGDHYKVVLDLAALNPVNDPCGIEKTLLGLAVKSWPLDFIAIRTELNWAEMGPYLMNPVLNAMIEECISKGDAPRYLDCPPSLYEKLAALDSRKEREVMTFQGFIITPSGDDRISLR